MKNFIIILILLIFSNHAYSKEEVYYCVEKKATGIEPKENYTTDEYELVNFTAQIDPIKNTFASEDINMLHDNICMRMFTQEHVMQCNNDYGHMFAFNTNNNDFVFTTVIGISTKNTGDSLLISYGNCKKF